jgi:hypothetical protein
MNWLDLTSDLMVVSRGIAESKRFGITVVNFKYGSRLHNAQTLFDGLSAAQYDLAVVRYPSDKTELSMLIESNRYKALLTDPTVYWKSRKSLEKRPIEDWVQVSEVTITELPSVAQVIGSAFHGYQSHWHFNPNTNQIEMSEAYTEWVTNAIDSPTTHVFLMLDSGVGEPIGMAMIQIEENVLEILLAGIVVTRQGQGLYGQLLTHITNFGSAKGVDQVVISTQASNINVQKAWIAQGWVPAMTVQTVHIEKHEFSNSL